MKLLIKLIMVFFSVSCQADFFLSSSHPSYKDFCSNFTNIVNENGISMLLSHDSKIDKYSGFKLPKLTPIEISVAEMKLYEMLDLRFPNDPRTLEARKSSLKNWIDRNGLYFSVFSSDIDGDTEKELVLVARKKDEKVGDANYIESFSIFNNNFGVDPNYLHVESGKLFYFNGELMKFAGNDRWGVQVSRGYFDSHRKAMGNNRLITRNICDIKLVR